MAASVRSPPDEPGITVNAPAFTSTPALSPLAPAATWRVLDDDPALLARLPAGVEPVRADLAAAPEAAFAPAPRLVAASAFFDLTSAVWIERFADLLAASKVALYAALTYDGREVWSPKPAEEDAALAAFNRDMRRDKGFGPALGAAAHDALLACEAALRPGRAMAEVFDAHARGLDAAGFGHARLNACGYSVGARYTPCWLDSYMFYENAPLEIAPGMTFFLHMILMDSEAGAAMCLGRTSLVTETGAEPLSGLSLDLPRR